VFAALTGAAIAVYSLVDAQAVQTANPFAYLGMILLLEGVALTAVVRFDLSRLRRSAGPGLRIAVGSVSAYVLVLLAFRQRRASPPVRPGAKRASASTTNATLEVMASTRETAAGQFRRPAAGWGGADGRPPAGGVPVLIRADNTCGGRGIRTPEALAGLAVFKTAPFVRSGIPPPRV
jgi:hypothetical protein